MSHANARPVGDFIRVARAGLGYSRAKLAEELGLSRETIGRLERGQPTVWHIVIRRALKDMVKVHTAALEARRARRQAWLNDIRHATQRDAGGAPSVDPLHWARQGRPRPDAVPGTLPIASHSGCCGERA